MVAPLVILAALGAGSFIASSTYNFYQGYQRQAENQRYWNDYTKNTGIGKSKIKYPYRQGAYYDYGYMFNYASSVSNYGRKIEEIYA